MISLDLTKLLEVRKAGDWSNSQRVDLWSVENALRDHKIHDSWKECWRFGEFGQKSSIQYHLKLLLISMHQVQL